MIFKLINNIIIQKIKESFFRLQNLKSLCLTIEEQYSEKLYYSLLIRVILYGTKCMYVCMYFYGCVPKKTVCMYLDTEQNFIYVQYIVNLCTSKYISYVCMYLHVYSFVYVHMYSYVCIKYCIGMYVCRTIQPIYISTCICMYIQYIASYVYIYSI